MEGEESYWEGYSLQKEGQEERDWLPVLEAILEGVHYSVCWVWIPIRDEEVIHSKEEGTSLYSDYSQKEYFLQILLLVAYVVAVVVEKWVVGFEILAEGAILANLREEV